MCLSDIVQMAYIVSVDPVLFNSLDSPNSWHWLRNYGNIFDISGNIQLPRRQLSSICVICSCGSEFLSECPRRYIPTHCNYHVQQYYISRSSIFTWRNWSAIDNSTLGFDHLWTDHSFKKQVCKRNYVALPKQNS